MKKTITALLALFALLAAMPAAAQESPRTTIAVTVTANQQVIRTGPYARFAQKYLGVMAPLSDKRVCTITEATLDYSQGETAAPSAEVRRSGESSPEAISHTRNALEFTKVPIDRRDFTERSTEEAAREAAVTIFSLRKHRIELVTGMAGENVFGPGLPAALAELDRLEEEYLSLFMGKQSVQTIVKTYYVTPDAGETNRIVFRFSAADGLLPTDDLSGSPVVLEMKSVAPVAVPAPVGKTSRSVTVERQYFPGTVTCRLLEGKNELARKTMPVYQMGYYLDVQVVK